jgi:hypothetical protein
MTKPRSTEHGLLMSGPMALAAFQGLKTQTRRPLKPQPEPGTGVGYYSTDGHSCTEFVLMDEEDGDPIDAPSLCCPYGRVGERVYVRETYQTLGHGRAFGGEVSYAADSLDPMVNREAGNNMVVVELPDRDDRWRPLNWGKWRPSTHMPKWASRTWGTIASVRVERLRDISEADAKAEGVEAHDCDGVTYYGPFDEGHIDPRVEFQRLWDSLYSGDLSWASNPWVWVIQWNKEDAR